jgi:hypothetical protein
VLATVSASRIKWPLYFLAVGKIPRVETSQPGKMGPHWTSRRPSGCQTSDTSQGYLRCLRHAIPVSHPVHLLCNMHGPHRTDDVKQLAQFLDMELHYIPARATDKLQSLNRVIIDALKSRARRLFRCLVETDGDLCRTMTGAVEDTIQSGGN